MIHAQPVESRSIARRPPSQPPGRIAAALTAVLATTLLSAGCGGGGGGGSGGTATPSTPAAAVGPATPVAIDTATSKQPAANLNLTAVPASYPLDTAGQLRQVAFDYLNTLRLAYGSGVLKQEPLLDLAATNHAGYFHDNTMWATEANLDPATGRPLGHIETPGLPGFTGIQEPDRAKAVGYGAPYVGEGISFCKSSLLETCDARTLIDDLVNTIYHRAILTLPTEYLGMGVLRPAALGLTSFPGGLVVEQSFRDGKYGQVFPASSLRTWPLAQAPSARTAFCSEAPWPLPDVTPQTCVGNPLSIQTAAATTIRPDVFELRDEGGTLVPATLRWWSIDPRIDSQTAFLVPLSVLRPNTRFTARAAGKVSLLFDATVVPFAIEWTFTTAPPIAVKPRASANAAFVPGDTIAFDVQAPSGSFTWAFKTIQCTPTSASTAPALADIRTSQVQLAFVTSPGFRGSCDIGITLTDFADPAQTATATIQFNAP